MKDDPEDEEAAAMPNDGPGAQQYRSPVQQTTIQAWPRGINKVMTKVTATGDETVGEGHLQ